MGQKIGICVTTNNCWKHLIGIADSSIKAGKEVEIFFTGDGVTISQRKGFEKLIEIAKVAICEVSFRSKGYNVHGVSGLSDKDFMTQAKNAEMIEECDRYIIL